MIHWRNNKYFKRYLFSIPKLSWDRFPWKFDPSYTSFWFFFQNNRSRWNYIIIYIYEEYFTLFLTLRRIFYERGGGAVIISICWKMYQMSTNSNFPQFSSNAPQFSSNLNESNTLWKTWIGQTPLPCPPIGGATVLV